MSLTIEELKRLRELAERADVGSDSEMGHFWAAFDPIVAIGMIDELIAARELRDGMVRAFHTYGEWIVRVGPGEYDKLRKLNEEQK